MKYKFIAAFSDSGMYYTPGQIVDLDPEKAALFPEGILEVFEETPQAVETPPATQPPLKPPKG